MDIQKILSSVQTSIKNPEEREYFLIHESRYKTILKEIERIARSFGSLRMTVLDVGCFPYHMGAALEKMGCEVYGIASSHEPIANKKVSIINIETDRFPYKSNTFDLVLCSEVLEHLPHSPMPALQEMLRVTKSGGRVLVTTPNITRSINLGKMLLGKSPIPPAVESGKIYHRHNHEYEVSELRDMVAQAGWHIEKATQFIGYPPFRRRNKTDSPLLWSGKFTNYLLMKLFPRLADTLLVIGKK